MLSRQEVEERLKWVTARMAEDDCSLAEHTVLAYERRGLETAKALGEWLNDSFQGCQGSTRLCERCPNLERCRWLGVTP